MRIMSAIIMILMYSPDIAYSQYVFSEAGQECIFSFDAFEGTFETVPPGFAISKDGETVMGAMDDDFRGIRTNSVTTGGCYAWDLGNNDIALGCQPTESDFTPGFFMLSISNAAGITVSEITISQEIVCRNNADRSSSMTLVFSPDTTNHYQLHEFDFISPTNTDQSATWCTSNYYSNFRLDPRFTPGATMILKWQVDDFGGSGSRDEYGLNNLRITLHKPRPTVIMGR